MLLRKSCFTVLFFLLLPLLTVGQQAAEPAKTEAPPALKDYTLLPIGIEHVTFTIDPEKWHLVLVTPNYRFSRGSKAPDVSVVKGSNLSLDFRVVPHYNKMYDAAKAAGITLEAGSGYRSIETQTKLFNDRVRTHMKDSGLTEHQAIMKTNIRVAYPGASEHNLGLCMDFKGGAAFADTESFKWLVANAADFGFILRYPADKTEITGIIYEPWHWRYVGAETAKEIKSKGICLEEYYGKRFISPEESEKLKAKGLNVEDYLRKQGKK